MSVELKLKKMSEYKMNVLYRITNQCKSVDNLMRMRKLGTTMRSYRLRKLRYLADGLAKLQGFNLPIKYS